VDPTVSSRSVIPLWMLARRGAAVQEDLVICDSGRMGPWFSWKWVRNKLGRRDETRQQGWCPALTVRLDSAAGVRVRDKATKLTLQRRTKASLSWLHLA
jgi:hypothetical protein